MAASSAAAASAPSCFARLRSCRAAWSACATPRVSTWSGCCSSERVIGEAMLEIREFRRSDIPRVADLWMRAFRASDERAPQSLHAYFEEMFFETPWRDAQLPSLVCERGAG